ncbi:VIT1/CCC1 transporter family protein [Ovoidimarina sediminis]|uniref:VIT1/CCC1 transporter family protein n=1 Tax=Ovoidimarina sediminis TaxID=3079856 RepID=UPI00290E23AB|nr:VIT1/CCC1 transporter family protein [Rhodophyticola sp. MJ-SS7]MDU8943739.1 VIT1/CCC1 transporter family protein [Rhodophyticola sp. MJ-SS7]
MHRDDADPKGPDMHDHSPKAIADRLAAQRLPSRLKDAVLGGIDGAVTTLAIVAGVEGAGLSSNVVVVLGIANVLADGFSMAAGNFAGTRAEAEDVDRLRAVEEDHIRRAPEGEREELRQILNQKGLTGQNLEDAVRAISSHRDVWVDYMLVEEYGVSPSKSLPLRGAIATFLAFLAAGLVPLLPFIFGMDNAFLVSILMTLTVFCAIGAIRSRWSLRAWWWTSWETLLIGSVAATIAYAVGSLFHP